MKDLMLARTATRASTGLVKGKQLKLEQHRAFPVRTTRTRLKEALGRPTASAIQATRATPAQDHAQRVMRESIKLLQDLMLARTAARASTGLIVDKQLKLMEQDRVFPVR
jgi:hypothetical protein